MLPVFTPSPLLSVYKFLISDVRDPFSMDVLRAEIAKKRKQLEEIKNEGKKYFKRSELDNDSKSETSTISNENDNHKSEENLVIPDSLQDDINDKSILPRSEVIQKLRDRAEPILLFGESELGAFRRLRHMEIYEPEVIRGFRNDFQEAMEKVDKVYLDEMLNTDETKVAANDSTKSDNKDGEMTYEQIQEIYTQTLRKHNRETETKVILNFLHLLLRLWNEQLNNRPAEEKMGTKGKIAFATYKQTQVYLKPLLRKLKTNTLPEDIFESLGDIIKHLLNKNYIEASSAYLQMAIGNAPWPIGVTMVGIHARTGREKIFSKNVAHVLNDETQRKYIQALKRLMTKCQEFYPTDPSRCVEYQPTHS